MGSIIDLTFTHSATQLVFNFINQNTGSQLNSILFAEMTVPSILDSLYSWNLYTGSINQLRTPPNNIMEMTIDSLVISGICMPFVSDTTSIVGLYGINSLDSTVYISFNVPMPDSGYVSGRY